MSWWHYLLLVNFYLVLFFGFYVLLLRRETFFQLNRIYLVAASLLSFFIPLMQADWVKSLFITQKIQSTIYSSPVMGYTITFIPQHDVLTVGEVLNALYIGVMLFLVARLFWQLLILKKQIEKPEPSAAYSFFKKISMGKDAMKHDAIAAHEQVHAKQWHSVDVMIIETVMIINWFNPVVYLYRFAIKYIHEYIADRQVIQAGTDKAEYALLLLSQTFNVETHHLATPFFNHSLLKQRIMMLQKNKSQRIALAKYGLSAPLFVLMLILSSATVNDSKVVEVVNNKVERALDKPATEAVNVIADKTGLEKPVAVVTNLITPTLVEDFKAEIPEVTADTGRVFSAVDKQPSFPGGMPAFYQFISNTVRYPKVDKEANVQGKAYISFVIETDGRLTNIKALRGPSQTIMDEAVRTMKLSPRWTPGSQKGKRVRVQYTIPLAFTLDAQDVEKKVTGSLTLGDDKVFSAVEEQPSFPGGMEKFIQFLNSNLKYPAEMKEKDVQGKVYVSFIVEPDGALSGIKVLREPGYGAGEEALRVMKLSPKWSPGYQNGHPVRTQYTIPIAFGGNKTTILQGRADGGVSLSTREPGVFGSGVFVIDGKMFENEAGQKAFRGISQDDIASIEIFKSGDATSIYGDRGKYGVVKITTKNQKASAITLRGTTPATNPLYVLDGKPLNLAPGVSPLTTIPQEDIASMEILKDESAVKLYGERGKNGVVVIKTKSAKK